MRIRARRASKKAGSPRRGSEETENRFYRHKSIRGLLASLAAGSSSRKGKAVKDTQVSMPSRYRSWQVYHSWETQVSQTRGYHRQADTRAERFITTKRRGRRGRRDIPHLHVTVLEGKSPQGRAGVEDTWVSRPSKYQGLKVPYLEAARES